MTMESDFEKRGWIAKLWEETRYDEAQRAFIFDGIVDNDDLRDEIRNEIWDDTYFRDEMIDKMINDPPPRLKRDIVREIEDDPPLYLVQKIEERIRGDYLDQIGDLSKEINSLKERLENYKEEFAAYRKKHRAPSL